MIRPELAGRYSTASIILHWLMLLLLVAVYAAIEFREVFPKGSEPREAFKMWHFMLGMPLAGWMILSAEGEAIPFFGFDLPALVGENEQLAEQTEEIHKLGGTIGYWIIGIHAAASLFHHYILRDRILARMMPIQA